jgi:hypothetical protein
MQTKEVPESIKDIPPKYATGISKVLVDSSNCSSLRCTKVHLVVVDACARRSELGAHVHVEAVDNLNVMSLIPPTITRF